MEVVDASGYAGCADQVLAPESAEEVAKILLEASSKGIPVTVAGALTGLTGAAVPQGGWSLSARKMRSIEVLPGRAVAGAGALLREIQAAAASSGQFYAPDPTENTSSIGGNIAANASGSRSFRYGATREHVLALTVVLMDGRVLNLRRGEPVDFPVPPIALPRTRKHSAGYRLAPAMDFVDLFVGSEGTLGVVTEAELRLLPAPGELLSGVIFFPSEEAALAAVERWRNMPALRMLEYLDGASLKMMNVAHEAALMVEQDGEGELDMTGALEADSWFAASAADRERFRQFRHALPERVNQRIRASGFLKLSTDYAVPFTELRTMLSTYRSALNSDFRDRYVIFGHIGDAHLHVNIFPNTADEFARAQGIMTDLARAAVALGGTVGAEHGLGKRKAHLLAIQYSPEEIEAMREIKRRFDPHWLLGRGTLFTEGAAA